MSNYEHLLKNIAKIIISFDLYKLQVMIFIFYRVKYPCVSFLHIRSDGFQDADDDRHQQEWKDVVFSEFAVHIGADEVSQANTRQPG